MPLFKRKPKPNLIDLEKYLKQCQKWQSKGIPPMPPPGLTHRMNRAWTDEEVRLMRENRAVAQVIYERFTS